MSGSSPQDAWQAARAAWPGVEVAAHRYHAYLVERLGDGAAPAAVHHADLYLACACAAGDGRALRAFEHAFFPAIDRLAARCGLPDAERPELHQVLRQALFVRQGDRPPGVAAYSGRAALSTWLHVIVVRQARRLVQRQAGARAGGDDLLDDLVAPDADPQLALLKQRHGTALRAALSSALEALSPRERNLLRHHYLDGLTLDQLAALYKAHRATVARWLAGARGALREGACRALVERHAIEPDEMESLFRLVQSQIDVSFSRLLATGGAGR